MKQIASGIPTPQWKGYTMAELRYHRAMSLARIEMERERVVDAADRMRQGNFVLSSGLFSRLLGALNYTDYIVMVVRLWQNIAPLFRRKKKQQ